MNATVTIARETSGAIYGPAGIDDPYRYTLWRTLQFRDDPAKARAVGFVMLNPSTATHEADDPTIRRCIGYARRWGADILWVANIFALRSTDPKALYGHADPAGPENAYHLQKLAPACEFVVCAWGAHGAHLDQGRKVAAELRAAGADLRFLKLTQAGQPCHPLYLKADLEPQPWRAA